MVGFCDLIMTMAMIQYRTPEDSCCGSSFGLHTTMTTDLFKRHYALLIIWVVHLVSLRSERSSANFVGSSADAAVVDDDVQEVDRQLSCFDDEWWSDAFDNVKLVVHHNGHGAPCGEIGQERSSSSLFQAFQETFLQDAKQCPTSLSLFSGADDDRMLLYNDYEMESILTRLINHNVDTCNSSALDEDDRDNKSGFYGYCDRGPANTPVLHDHALLVPNFDANGSHQSSFLPCHFHTKAGLRIASLAHLAQLARQQSTRASGRRGEQQGEELHLYAVPAGRYFMFAPSYAGEVIDLEHVAGGDAETFVSLKVLSVQPRVFELINFVNPTREGDVLLQQALTETREELRLSRSTVDAKEKFMATRTSDTGWDTNSTVAKTLKRYVRLYVMFVG
jgi:hypothetical protein